MLESDQIPTPAASTLTPESEPVSSKPDTQSPSSTITIEFPPARLANDARFVGALARIVNAAYLETEADIFKPGYQRTTSDSIASLVRAGQLAVAFLPLPLPPPQLEEAGVDWEGKVPIGCISIRHAARYGELGMLALDAAHRGRGLGRDLVGFAERHCGAGPLGLPALRLELLVPTAWEHPFKARLLRWYRRMGYVPLMRDEEEEEAREFAREYPELAPLLAGPAELRVLEKVLVVEAVVG
ncbi:hypothetical protein F4775DRAFT_597767 [Biscogniauxia sp. FL1348]|nr:hypothetical protein F4775DRAFT_597767 [Biscogniauxia sp. FL1348]